MVYFKINYIETKISLDNTNHYFNIKKLIIYFFQNNKNLRHRYTFCPYNILIFITFVPVKKIKKVPKIC